MAGEDPGLTSNQGENQPKKMAEGAEFGFQVLYEKPKNVIYWLFLGGICATPHLCFQLSVSTKKTHKNKHITKRHFYMDQIITSVLKSSSWLPNEIYIIM